MCVCVTYSSVGRHCCLSSKNIFYMCTHNLSQNCSKRSVSPSEANLMCVYDEIVLRMQRNLRIFSTCLFNLHNYKLSIGIFPRKSVYSMGEKYPLEQIFYTNISCWNLLSGRFMPRKESEKKYGTFRAL